MVDGHHTLEVLPVADDFHTTLDGTITSSKELQEDWIHCRVFGGDSHESLVVFLTHSGVNLEYDVKSVIITIPEGSPWHGQCYAVASNKETISPSTEAVVHITEKVPPLLNKIVKTRYLG